MVRGLGSIVRTFFLAGTIIGTGLGPATAEDTITLDRKWGEIGTWQVYANKAQNACFAVSQFEDGTYFWFGISRDGKNSFFAIANKSWSDISVGKKYQLKVVFDGLKSRTSDFRGVKNSGFPGYYAYGLDRAVARDIARLSVVQFFKDDKEIAILSLKGTSAAFQESEKCRNAVAENPIAFFAGGNRAAELNARANELEKNGRFDEAAILYKDAIAFIQETMEPESLDLGMVLLNFAQLLDTQGKYPQAEATGEQALSILKKHLGKDHQQIGKALNSLALINRTQGNLEKAARQLEEARRILESAFGPEHEEIVTVWGNLAGVYSRLGRYADAESLFEKALNVTEERKGEEHLDTALTLNNLGTFYLEQGKYREAEPLLERAYRIREKAYSSDNLELATSHNNLAALYRELGRYIEAEHHQRMSPPPG